MFHRGLGRHQLIDHSEEDFLCISLCIYVNYFLTKLNHSGGLLWYSRSHPLDQSWFQPQVGQAILCKHHFLSYILFTFSSSVQPSYLLSCNQGTNLEPFYTLLRRFQVDQALDSSIMWWFCCFLFPDSHSLPLHSFFLGSLPKETTCTTPLSQALLPGKPTPRHILFP